MYFKNMMFNPQYLNQDYYQMLDQTNQYEIQQSNELQKSNK
jgi:hypothetical protein